MALSVEERKHWCGVINNTGGHGEIMFKERII